MVSWQCVLAWLVYHAALYLELIERLIKIPKRVFHGLPALTKWKTCPFLQITYTLMGNKGFMCHFNYNSVKSDAILILFLIEQAVLNLAK